MSLMALTWPLSFPVGPDLPELRIGEVGGSAGSLSNPIRRPCWDFAYVDRISLCHFPGREAPSPKESMDRPIYLDNNATTPLLPEVLEAMLPYFAATFGNPASSHRHGTAGASSPRRRKGEDCRAARRRSRGGYLHQRRHGSQQSRHLRPGPRKHLVASPIEHPCVSEPVRRLGDLGEKSHAISYLPVDQTGIVRWHEEVMRPDTGLVSVMLANHETGAVQPIAALVESLAAGPCSTVMPQRGWARCRSLFASWE